MYVISTEKRKNGSWLAPIEGVNNRIILSTSQSNSIEGSHNNSKTLLLLNIHNKTHLKILHLACNKDKGLKKQCFCCPSLRLIGLVLCRIGDYDEYLITSPHTAHKGSAQQDKDLTETHHSLECKLVMAGLQPDDRVCHERVST